jgi:hypothetical protein
MEEEGNKKPQAGSKSRKLKTFFSSLSLSLTHSLTLALSTMRWIEKEEEEEQK